MTIEVIGKDDDLCFNNLAWKLLIELALQFGWKPAGAMEPDEEEDGSEPDEEEDGLAAEQVVKLTEETLEQHRAPQDDAIAQAVKSLFFHSGDPVLDSYFNNAGFRVTADDANALADALDRALPDLPDHNALEHKVVTIASEPGQSFLPLGTPVTPVEWFSGPNKPYLKKFIVICRQGEFKIW